MFTRAIVRKPCKNIVKGITSQKSITVNYEKAILQHELYVKALNNCNLDVTVLDADEEFPDSTFIEDTALLTPECAIVTRPGNPKREKEAIRIKEIVKKFYSDVESVKEPGQVDAGDIMMARDHYYIGLSSRTNAEGARQVISILKRHNLTGATIEVESVLHLKTGVSYLENNNLLVCGEFIEKEEFNQFNLLKVFPKEEYSANCVWINGKVLFPKGYPETKEIITKCGYEIIELEMSEFRKLDGGLSCLSLRF